MSTLLALHGVSKSFTRGQSELNVLSDVWITVDHGRFAAVFGDRCAGKTTLLRIAAGLERPDEGLVYFEGRDLASSTADELAAVYRSRVAWVDRGGPAGDDLTMLDYVGLPLFLGRPRREVARLASDALDKSGVGDCGGARWSDLSDGERAQVSIARALVRSPRLIVIDDPTAGLGIIERERILAFLRATVDETGAGVLMAVPDVPSMDRCHEVFSLAGGRLLGAAQSCEPPGVVLDFHSHKRSG